MDQYDEIQQIRSGSNKKGYGKQLEELGELRLGPRVRDPNEIEPVAKTNIMEPDPPAINVVEVIDHDPVDPDKDVDDEGAIEDLLQNDEKGAPKKGSPPRGSLSLFARRKNAGVFQGVGISVFLGLSQGLINVAHGSPYDTGY